MASLMPVAKQQFFYPGTALPLVGGQLYTYAAGTSTPKTTWQDSAGTIPNTNPITLDSTGSALVFWSGSYKVVLKDSAGSTVYTVDNYNTDLAAQLQAQLAASPGASLVGFLQSGIGAVARTTQDELRETVKVTQFGVKGDGSDEYAGIKKAWDYCVGAGKNLHFPAGTYNCGIQNFPFKNSAYPAASLLDCAGITISGAGAATIFKTDSSLGADVVNVYSCQNLHFRDFSVTARLSGTTGSGSNGISVVGGFNNVTFDNIWCNNLPYVDKGTYLDGGKALTIQPGTPATECGTLKATRIFAKGCVYGAGLEVDLSNWGTKKHSISIDVVAEDCYQGVVFSGAAAVGALSPGMTMGYRVRAQLINCQRSIYIGRAHGVDIEGNVITTKSAAARRLNPGGTAWTSSDTVVDGLFCAYAKDSRIGVYGDLGGCDYKVQIGGAAAGTSGMTGATESCDFYFDLGGTAATSSFNLVNSGGNTMSNSRLYASAASALTVPVAAYAPNLSNVLMVGPALRAINVLVAGELDFPYTDGSAVFHKIIRNGDRLDFSAAASSSASNINYGFLKHDGTLLVGFRNDGNLITQGRATATSVSTVKQVMPVYDNTNTLIGYLPIYTTYA